MASMRSSLTLVVAALAGAAGIALACSEPHSHEPAAYVAAKSATEDYWVGPSVSGSWFAADRSGEGFILQFLEDGSALAVWFTYPAEGEAGEQAWLFAQNGVVDGDTIRFPIVYRPQGARFGEAFDPADVVLENWGTLELAFSDCGNATASWSGPPAYGSGTRALVRLTTLEQLDCNGRTKLTSTGARSLAGVRAKSGAWFVPSRSGEGWLVEELPDGRSVVYWFTYTPDGRQAWTVGIANRDGDRLVIEDNLIPTGTRFGEAFDADDVVRAPWGRIEFTFTCQSVAVSYASTLTGWGSATRQGTRLTALGSAGCIDGTPAAPSSLQWTEKARMPDPPQTEHAVAVYEGKLYALGGFLDTRGFKRYDPATDSWSELPDLPAGRDHLAAFASAGGMFMVGGDPNGGGEQTRAGFRYDFATQQWAPVEVLQPMYGSHAALLNGRAYVGDLDGSLQEYDPRTNRHRRIARFNSTPRDHSQVVAFLGEIWMIAGRIPETRSVAIYDPVSESWRFGPNIARGRGGFAAAVSGHHIVIAGGEVLSGQPRVEPSVETYTAGEDTWRLRPNLPDPVHGVAAGTIDGRVYVVSGARVAATFQQTTGRLFQLTLVP